MRRRHFVISAAALGAAPAVWAAGSLKPGAHAALIVVDVQNCFVDGGTLPVKGGAEVVPVINKLAPAFQNIVITQDWHTPGHASFASAHAGKKPFETTQLSYGTQVLWPDHCVQGTSGAEFHKDLNREKVDHIIQKGKNIDFDSYSGFQDNNHFTKTGLDDYLKYHDIQLLEVVGLALDYCVKFTCLDAAQLGYVTCLHFNGTRAVNVKPENGKDAIYEMLQNSVTILG